MRQAAVLTSCPDLNGGIVLPPQVEQAIRFEEEVGTCSFLICFLVSDETMIERLIGRAKTSGRADDNLDTIKQRLVTFHKHSQPIMERYKDKLVSIPAERDVDEIFQDVCQCIADRCSL